MNYEEKLKELSKKLNNQINDSYKEALHNINNRVNNLLCSYGGRTIALWFSCGVASAVCASILIKKYGYNNTILLVNNPVENEHEDNNRFLKDCEKWLGHEIIYAINPKYPSCNINEVFEKRKYISGVHGAPCTSELKKGARYEFEKNNHIDFHVLGFGVDEKKRQINFSYSERQNTISVMIDENISKDDCFQIIKDAGIEIPLIYLYGLPNANCIGCVKSQSPTYWNLIRKWFPEIFKERAEISRRLGVRLVKYKGKRIFLDELPVDAVGGKIKSYDCGIFCNDN